MEKNMTGEIKEILEDLKSVAENPSILVKFNEDGEEFMQEYDNYLYLEYNQTKLLLDYITALEEENKELKLLSMTQNNREYRSKFLKEYQKEHGGHCYPDYDEVYKRYDKLKSNNDAAIEYINHENFKRNILVGVGTKKYTRDILNNVLNILQRR